MVAKDSANARGGFYGSFEPGNKPALLVIDFQLGFTDPSLSPLAGDFSAQIAATNRLIASMRGLGPVIFTAVAYEPHMADAGLWPQKCSSLSTLGRGTKAAELDPRLQYDPAADLLLYKTQASTFFGTPLAGILATQGCNMLVIAGCTTSGCVRASTVDAMQHGFPPFVVRDCVGDRSAAQHESNLIDIESKYGEVIGVDRMLDVLDSVRSGNAKAAA